MITIFKKHPTQAEVDALPRPHTCLFLDDGALVLSKSDVEFVLRANIFPIIVLPRELEPILLDKNVFFCYSKDHGAGIKKFKEEVKTLPPYWWYNKSICIMVHHLLKDEHCFFVMKKKHKLKVFFFFEKEWHQTHATYTSIKPKTEVKKEPVVCHYCAEIKPDTAAWSTWIEYKDTVSVCPSCLKFVVPRLHHEYGY